jgi:hypothetical protein
MSPRGSAALVGCGLSMEGCEISCEFARRGGEMGIVFLIRHQIARARCVLAQSAKAQSEAKAQARARLVAFASACARRRRADPVDKSACGSNPIRSRWHARIKPNSLPLARAKQTQCISAPRGIKPGSLQSARAEQTQFAHSPCADQTQFASVRARGTNPICFISRARGKIKGVGENQRGRESLI